MDRTGEGRHCASLSAGLCFPVFEKLRNAARGKSLGQHQSRCGNRWQIRQEDECDAIEFLPLSAHHDPVGRFLEETEPDRTGAKRLRRRCGRGHRAPRRNGSGRKTEQSALGRDTMGSEPGSSGVCCSEASVSHSSSHVLGGGPQLDLRPGNPSAPDKHGRGLTVAGS